MIKGSQKQMIVLRTGGSRYFDEAYFVLRQGVFPSCAAKRDILGEANRILEEAAFPYRRKHHPNLSTVWLFLGGVFLGAGICALILLCAI